MYTDLLSRRSPVGEAVIIVTGSSVYIRVYVSNNTVGLTDVTHYVTHRIFNRQNN